jgi:subtilase family serine protease
VRISGFGRYVLSTLVAVAMLAGCAMLPTDKPTPVESSLGPLLAPNVRFACPEEMTGYAQCLALIRTDSFGERSPRIHGYTPSDLQAAYDLPSRIRGLGQTIAVVDSGDNPNAEVDVNTYRSHFGLPRCTISNGCFQKLNQNGRAGDYPPSSAGDGVEIDLDIEMVSASCPLCHIMLVEANGWQLSNLATSVDTAVAKGADVVSNSYGFLGDVQDDAYGSHYNHPGIVILAAAGDRGYQSEGGFPADQPSVVSVGGTTLRRTRNRGGWSETVWQSSPYEGTGSGCTSSRTPKPAWQRDRKPGNCPYRTMNDVAAVADPNTGVAEYDSYGMYGPWFVAGGTSAAAPLVAGIYGLAENAARQHAARSLYRRHSQLYDVMAGQDGICSPSLSSSYLCRARPGYDGPSGNGSPHGVGGF